jgi:hypothetical protein
LFFRRHYQPLFYSRAYISDTQMNMSTII